MSKFDDQFNLPPSYYLRKLDFLDWFRYFYIIKAIIASQPRHVLEVGVGSGIVRNCVVPVVETYVVMDVNPRLRPDVLADVRAPQSHLQGRFDCIIVADVLEHMPFGDVSAAMRNLRSYLRDTGEIVVTIPHRRSHFLFMTPTQQPHVVTVPTGFLSPAAFYRRFIKRKVWIDPHHQWEIGDGRVRRAEVEATFERVGLRAKTFRKLLYVDFWVLMAVG